MLIYRHEHYILLIKRTSADRSTMFRIIDPQGNLVAEVFRRIATSTSNQYIDYFVDDNDNLYLERPHSEMINLRELSPILITKAEAFYQIRGLIVQAGH
jgi:hypothetical protein